MATTHVFYNPMAGNGKGEESAKLLELILPEPIRVYDMTRITNYAAVIAGMAQEDCIVVCGGDGTLSRFANDTAKITIPQHILYYPIGTGNDFARDMDKRPGSRPFSVTQQLQDLPTVEVKGKKYRFLNGIGFGIDGYCCQVGDELKKAGKKVDYTAIAVKGLLFHFVPRNAVVTVDGERYTYSNVWIAPTMLGRYYGGGMIPAPDQRRDDPERKLSLMIFHGSGRLKTLAVFPGIFQGKHVKHTKQVAIHAGHEITVEFDRPTPLQIDGETVPNVTAYTARSCAHAKLKV